MLYDPRHDALGGVRLIAVVPRTVSLVEARTVSLMEAQAVSLVEVRATLAAAAAAHTRSGVDASASALQADVILLSIHFRIGYPGLPIFAAERQNGKLH